MPLDAVNITISEIEAEQRRRASQSFRAFIRLVNPAFQFYPHCELLIDICEKVARGELKRVMVQLPPRHTKSELFSRLFSAYYLLRNPKHFVGVNSYSAELAYTLSRAARQNFIEAGGSVRDDAAAVKHWETTQNGGLWAAGVGGSITGKGFSLGLIDDPLKNSEEASSPVIREKHKEWYSSTFYTRQEPDAAIVIIQTRWHEDDLTGWLLSEETNGELPEKWHVVCLPAFGGDMAEFPPSCTIEPDARATGEALCPERYDTDKLSKIKARIGSYHFGALYQQRPTPKSGAFFHVDMLEVVDAAPVEAYRYRGWDKAATKDDGDFTAGVLVAKAKDGIYYIEDVVRGQWDTATRDRLIRQTAEIDGRGVKVKGEQEPGSGGKESAQAFIKLLAGFSVSTEPSTQAKELRADPLSSQVNAGNVKLVRGDWNKAFIEELRQFPHGKHDDQVDGVSLAFNAASHRTHPADPISESERLVMSLPEDLRPDAVNALKGHSRESAHYRQTAEAVKAKQKIDQRKERGFGQRNPFNNMEWK